jgi:hypothetical protein
MSSDLSRILQLLQQPMLKGHTSYILEAPASGDLALFPSVSETRSSGTPMAPEPSSPCPGER